MAECASPSRVQNVEAVQELAQDWINDWYEGTAHAYVLPAPAPELTFIDVVLETLLEATQTLNFSYRAVDPSDVQQQRTEFLTENSTPNTALSLDGRSQTGQSVGQHVCTG